MYICTYISLRSVAFLLFAYANVAEILKRCGSMARKLILKYSQMYTVHMYVCMHTMYTRLYTLHTYVRTGFGRAYKLPSCLMVVAFLLLDATQVCHSKKHIHMHIHIHTHTLTEAHRYTQAYLHNIRIYFYIYSFCIFIHFRTLKLSNTLQANRMTMAK